MPLSDAFKNNCTETRLLSLKLPPSIYFPKLFKAFENKNPVDMLLCSAKFDIYDFAEKLKESAEKFFRRHNIPFKIEAITRDEDVQIEFGLWTAVYYCELTIECDGRYKSYFIHHSKEAFGDILTKNAEERYANLGGFWQVLWQYSGYESPASPDTAITPQATLTCHPERSRGISL